VEDDEGIKKYFAAFHLHDTFPLSVVVDDFGDFFYERYSLFFIFQFSPGVRGYILNLLWLTSFGFSYFPNSFKEMPREIW
jgi:hypothetical protein